MPPALSCHNSKVWILLAFLAFGLWGCDKGSLLENLPPDSHLSTKEMNLSGEQRLNSTIRLSWYGTDQDGYVIGYEYSLDGVLWNYTATQDTTFLFRLEENTDTTDILFYLRAIDNEGVRDPSPAFLRIPLKNTAPFVEANRSSLPSDTVLSVLSFQWQAGDADGDNTLTSVWMRLNEGDWFPLGLNERLITLLPVNPKATGLMDAHVYVNTSGKAGALTIKGLINGGFNTIYLKASDIAGAESKIDTLPPVYVREIRSDLLVIGTQPPEVASRYLTLLNESYPKGYDYLDYNRNNGELMPRFWNPGFQLLLKSYPKLFVFSDQSRLINPQTGQSGLFPEFIGQSVQQYTDQGGKYLMTMSFPSNTDLSDIRGPFPIDSLSASRGQAVVSNDSFVTPLIPGYPVLQATNLILGADPFVPTINAEPFYSAQVTSFGSWSGPRTVAARRTRNGKVSQVFFSLELHLLDRNRSSLIALFNAILNEDFKD